MMYRFWGAVETRPDTCCTHNVDTARSAGQERWPVDTHVAGDTEATPLPSAEWREQTQREVRPRGKPNQDYPADVGRRVYREHVSAVSACCHSSVVTGFRARKLMPSVPNWAALDDCGAPA